MSFNAESPTSPAQERTRRARAAFDAKFATPEEKSAHFRELAHRSNEGRLVLSATDAAALGDAYAVLGRIASKLQPLDELSESEPPAAA